MTTHFRKSFLAFLTLLAFAAHPAMASINDIRWEDNGLGFNIGGQDLIYGESDATGTLDTERGWMPDISLSYDMLRDQHKWYTFLNNLYLHIDGEASFGDTKYNGALQEVSGNSIVLIPNQTTNQSQIYSINGRIGRGIAVGNQVMLIPFGDVGYRYWIRDLTGPGGYEEKYSNGDIQAGLMAQWSPLSRWVFSLTAEAGTTFSSSVNIALGDGVTLPLQSTAIWQGAAKIGYALTNKLQINTALQFKGFGYGASTAQPLTFGGVDSGLSLSEPASYTHETTLTVGLFYHI